jgi:hypothetical protein
MTLRSDGSVTAALPRGLNRSFRQIETEKRCKIRGVDRHPSHPQGDKRLWVAISSWLPLPPRLRFYSAAPQLEAMILTVLAGQQNRRSPKAMTARWRYRSGTNKPRHTCISVLLSGFCFGSFEWSL